MTVMHSLPTPVAETAPTARQTLADYLQRLSEDEFYAFCQQNPEQKFERRADGIIELMSLTGGESGRRNSELTTDLTIWNRQHRQGQVFDSSTGFRLPNGAVRSPDAAWVSTSAWEALTPEQRRKHLPLCPEFAVELLSETDTVSDTVIKMQEYLDNGLRLGWLIDPKTETARVFRANGTVDVNSFADTLSGEDVLPGFVFALGTLR
jgi:Uma2 family endonuclease